MDQTIPIIPPAHLSAAVSARPPSASLSQVSESTSSEKAIRDLTALLRERLHLSAGT
jgi:hypothetical protein